MILSLSIAEWHNLKLAIGSRGKEILISASGNMNSFPKKIVDISCRE